MTCRGDLGCRLPPTLSDGEGDFHIYFVSEAIHVLPCSILYVSLLGNVCLPRHCQTLLFQVTVT